MFRYKLVFALSAMAFCLAAKAQARQIDIPSGDLKSALDSYASQFGMQVLYNVDDVKGLSTSGAHGELSDDQALTSLLKDTGLSERRDTANAVVIFRGTLFDVPAQDVRSAIAAIAHEGKLNIIVPSDANGVTSNPVKGATSAHDALKQALAGTGLAIGNDDGKTITLKQENVAALGTVTVTAQKRSESAQKVPISMTTFTAKQIDTYRLQSLRDVSHLTPGLLVSSFDESNPTIAIRGISNTFNQIGVNKPVAIVVDDVVVPRNSAASFDLFGLDSISVLKGPQGTLFGQNVTGGAIVINTKQPSYYERQADAQVTYGNYNDRAVQALLNVPFNERLAFNFTTNIEDRDGYGRDRLTGKEEDGLNTRNYRGNLRFQITPDLEATLSAHYSLDWNGGRTLSSDTLGDDGNPRTSELGVNQSYERAISGTSLRFKWNLPVGDFTSITALEKSQSLENYSGVGANYQFLKTGNQQVTRDAEQVKTFSQEFRYASPKWTLGDFLLGTYYSNQDGFRQLTTTGLAAKTGAVAVSTLGNEEAHTMSYGVFGDGTIHLPYQFDLTAGVRYTYDDKIAGLVYTDHLTPRNNFAVTGAQSTAGEFTPRVVLSWHPQKDFMTYASVTRGFTSGGFNSDATSVKAFNQGFAPEKVTNYELGFKSQWLDDRLRVNGAIYDMKYTDKQEFVFNSTTGILDIVNAGRATVKGAELEVAYKPVNWLNTSVTYGLIDGRYDDFHIGTVNNTGHSLANAPRTSISLAADVNLPLFNTAYRFIGSGSFSWQSQVWTGATQDPGLNNPAYGLLNFSLGVESPDGKYRLVAWVRNATDKEYVLTRSTSVVQAEYLGEPRMFGVTFTGRF